jgi:hypothetical protein
MKDREEVSSKVVKVNYAIYEFVEFVSPWCAVLLSSGMIFLCISFCRRSVTDIRGFSVSDIAGSSPSPSSKD